MLIGLSGKMGAGKDTAAELLKTVYDVCQESFALNVKTITALLTGTTLEENIDRKLRHKTISQLGHVTLARVQQLVGQGMRDLIHPDVWIHSVLAQERPEDCITVITDVRYPNEVQAIEQAGGIVIRIIGRQNFEQDSRPKDHPSETALDGYDFEHVVVNDGSKEDLLIKILKIIKPV